MKKLYITPELEITKFDIDTLVLSSNGNHDGGNIETNPWSSDSEPEVTTDFSDLPW